MATQRITIAKVAGTAGDAVARRLGEWSTARLTTDPDEWSNEQWPEQVRRAADQFADRLRANALAPPVVYFVEWADMWSMGYLFTDWLRPPDAPPPIMIYADQSNSMPMTCRTGAGWRNTWAGLGTSNSRNRTGWSDDCARQSVPGKGSWSGPSWWCCGNPSGDSCPCPMRN